MPNRRMDIAKGAGAGRTDSGERVPMADADVVLFGNFLDGDKADALCHRLRREIAWKTETIRLFGKQVAMPRLVAWHGDLPYTYSGLTMPAEDWPPCLTAIRAAVSDRAAQPFNGVLLNLYRDGRDSMSWHADDEPELGQEPVIASLSLGSARRFVFRRKDDKAVKVSLDLPHGSLLVMAGPTQHHWHHAVPKTAKPVSERINLTFRTLFG